MKKAVHLILLPICLITACNKSAGETHDVAWYTAHKDERTSEIKRCNDNPGEFKNDAGCRNAQQSEDQQTLDPNNSNIPHL